MRELHRSDYFILTLDEERHLVRRARTEISFPTIAEAEAAYESMLRPVDMLDRSRYSLLADVRLAPPRNDPAFEIFVERYLPRLYGGYRRAATLVKTQAGRLQITRLMKDQFEVHTFTDEAAALAYLAGDAK